MVSYSVKSRQFTLAVASPNSRSVIVSTAALRQFRSE